MMRLNSFCFWSIHIIEIHSRFTVNFFMELFYLIVMVQLIAFSMSSFLCLLLLEFGENENFKVLYREIAIISTKNHFLHCNFLSYYSFFLFSVLVDIHDWRDVRRKIVLFRFIILFCFAMLTKNRCQNKPSWFKESQKWRFTSQNFIDSLIEDMSWIFN